MLIEMAKASPKQEKESKSKDKLVQKLKYKATDDKLHVVDNPQ